MTSRATSAPSVIIAACIAAVLAWLAWALWGCAHSDRQRALTAITRAVTIAVGPMGEAVAAEERACLAGDPTYAQAHACVRASRARWAGAWAAVDLLAAIDESALSGAADVAAAIAAYCDVRAVWPALPAPPPVIGECL